MHAFPGHLTTRLANRRPVPSRRRRRRPSRPLNGLPRLRPDAAYVYRGRPQVGRARKPAAEGGYELNLPSVRSEWPSAPDPACTSMTEKAWDTLIEYFIRAGYH
jgi:hypothetical protein